MAKAINQNDLKEIIDSSVTVMKTSSDLITEVVKHVVEMGKIKAPNVKTVIKLLQTTMDYLTELCELITEKLPEFESVPDAEKTMLSLNKTFKSIVSTIDIIGKAKIMGMLMAPMKLRLMGRAVKQIAKLVDVIDKIPLKSVQEAQKKMDAMKQTVQSLATTASLMILITPILIGFIIISPIIILAFWITAKIMGVISNIISKRLGAVAMKGMLKFILLLGLMLVIITIVILMAAMADKVLKGIPSILKLLVSILLITATLAAMGLICLALTPIAPYIGIGMGLMAGMVITILAISYMLLLLQYIELDQNAIETNVGIVMETALGVIKVVFETAFNMGGGSKDQPWYKQLFNYILGSYMFLYTTILASVFLTTTALSIGMILLTASFLRLLQMIELDVPAIKTNVGIVISTAMEVIAAIFTRNDAIEDNKTGKDWFVSILKWVGGAFVTVLGAVLASVFLSTTAVSICMVLLTASFLRLLQVLDLNPDKIKTNVGIVIDTAMGVIAAIFIKGNPEDVAAEKGWFVSVLEFVGGSLLSIIGAVLALGFLATTLVSISLVLIMAGELRLLQEIELDPDTVTNNVGIVINTARGVIAAIFNPDDSSESQSDKSWFRTVLEWVGGTFVTLIGAILALGFLSLTLVSISLVLLLAKQLSTLQDIKLDNKKIQDNINMVVNAAHIVIAGVMTPVELPKKKKRGLLGKLLEWAFPGLMALIDAMVTIAFLSMSCIAVGTLSKIAEYLVTINNFPKMDNIYQKTQSIVSTAKSVISAVLNYGVSKNDTNAAESAQKKVTSLQNTMSELHKLTETMNGLPNPQKLEPKMAYLEELNTVMGKLSGVSDVDVKKTGTILNHYSTFVTKLDHMKLEKLQTAQNMFKHMAEFSKSINGDFKELADTINEEVTPMLKNLNETMDKMPRKIKDATRSIVVTLKEGKQPTLSYGEIESQIRDNYGDTYTKADKAERAKLDATIAAEAKERFDKQAKAFEPQMLNYLQDILDRMAGTTGAVQVEKWNG